MTLEEIQNNAVNRYNKNLEFLSSNHKELFDKIKLFEMAIELNEINSRYELEYKDDYFDILDKNKESFIYGNNSIKYSNEIAEKVNFSATSNTFRTFYGIEYEKEIGEKSKDFSIFSSFIYGNAPIINYVNNNLPKKEVMKNIYMYVFLGTGLGLHLPKIDKKMQARLCLIVEPSLEIFRLSLFVTDYEELSKNKILEFSISENQDVFKKRFKFLHTRYNLFNHYIKFCLFSNSCKPYTETMQSIFVTQSHYLYSYDRQIQSLKRTYDYANKEFNYLNLSENYDFPSLNDKPVIILAAGPSLHKELDFLLKNKDKFIIVAIYALMPLLEKNNIVPNFIVQYEESPRVVGYTLSQVKDKEFFKTTLFFFASHVCNELMTSLPKKNIYVFNALYEAKEKSSIIVAPSIGEITYKLLLKLGANRIYFLGIDMALDQETGESHFKGYFINEGKDFSSRAKKESDSDTNHSLLKNKMLVKGNFQKMVYTLSIFTISIDHINSFTKEYMNIKPLKLFNLSSGAFFESITPLRPKDVDVDNFQNLDKDVIREELVESLKSISSTDFSKEDRVYNLKKIEDSNKLKNTLDSFIVGKKYSNNHSLQLMLDKYYKELYISSSCKDLNAILHNYCNHNLPYIYYFINIKDVNNPKKHIKYLIKAFHKQVVKLINEYENIILVKEENK